MQFRNKFDIWPDSRTELIWVYLNLQFSSSRLKYNVRPRTYFVCAGYEFDPGIHYIGEMQCNSLMKFLLDQLSEGQVTWEPLEKEYDTVAIGDLADPKLYPIVAGKEDFKNTLYEKFPDEKQAIDHYFALLEVCKSYITL